jgi:hypothetical protein
MFYLDNVSIEFIGHAGTHTMAIGPALGHPIVVSDAVPAGHAALFTIQDLPSGHYVIWCTIGAHASEGMTGTLTVQ